MAAILAAVMFPLWPVTLRIGVWYLSMGLLGLIGLFFVMAICRLILFCATVFTVPPGLWLYPNLFEDVGFFDSFRPVWGWQEVCPESCPRCIAISNRKQDKKKKSKNISKAGKDTKDKVDATTSTPKTPNGSSLKQRDLTPRVEEVEDD